MYVCMYVCMYVYNKSNTLLISYIYKVIYVNKAKV